MHITKFAFHRTQAICAYDKRVINLVPKVKLTIKGAEEKSMRNVQTAQIQAGGGKRMMWEKKIQTV